MLSTHPYIALWTALWRFSERAIDRKTGCLSSGMKRIDGALSGWPPVTSASRSLENTAALGPVLTWIWILATTRVKGKTPALLPGFFFR